MNRTPTGDHEHDMDTHVSANPQRMIEDAAGILGSLSAPEARLLMAATADIVVVIDRDLTVVDVGYADAALGIHAPATWVGRPFIECVTSESVDKARALVSGALGGQVLVGRQVNHPPADGSSPFAPDLAVTYRAASVNGGERFVLLGTDLRPITELQSRLLRAQLDTERDVRRLREVETRYRLLFHLADTPLVIVEADALEIVDANEAAGTLFGRQARKMVGLPLPALFARPDQTGVAAEVVRIAERGRGGTIEAEPGKGGASEGPVRLTVEPYRESGGNHLLVRGGADREPAPMGRDDPIRAAIAAMPDGVVVIDRGGYVIDANEAALDFVRLASIDRLVGRRADRWLGGTGVDMQVLTSALKERGSVRRFATVVRDELGGETAVDISAAHVTAGGEPVYGLVLREAMSVEPVSEDEAHGPGRFAELVGRVPLRDLVRDTADIIEKLCIEEALRQTENNRASAADMLGLSRQSLYMKLKRYGLEEGPRSN